MLATILAIGIVAYIFNKQHPKQVNLIYRPLAEFGVQDNQCAVHIINHRGDEYIMACELYSTKFREGGYNAVIRTYYTQPSDTHFKLVDNFTTSKSSVSTFRTNDFYNSYSDALEADTIYEPKSAIIQKSIKMRQQMHGPKFIYANAKPTQDVTTSNSDDHPQ